MRLNSTSLLSQLSQLFESRSGVDKAGAPGGPQDTPDKSPMPTGNLAGTQGAGDVDASQSDNATAGTDTSSGNCNDVDPTPQQTTMGPELKEMLEFMAKFIAAMQYARAQQDGDTVAAAQGSGGGNAAQGSPDFGEAVATTQSYAPAVAGAAMPEPAAASPGEGPGRVAQSPLGSATSVAPPAEAPVANAGRQPPAVSPVDSAAKPADGGPSQKMSVDGGGNHTIHLTDTSSGDEDIGAIQNAGSGMSPGNTVEAHTKLKPGQSVDISMPDDWKGRFQDLSGGKGGQAAWLEYNNEKKGGGKIGGTFFDAEDTTGRDHSIQAKSGESTAGDTNKLLQAAPDDLKTTNSAGQQVIKGAELGGVVNQAVVDFESKYEPAKGQSASGQYNNYIMPNNDTATRHSDSNTMDVEFGDA